MTIKVGAYIIIIYSMLAKLIKKRFVTTLILVLF